MLPVGRGLLIVALLACLVSVPTRAQAAEISLGTLSSGTFDFGDDNALDDFIVDNEVALIFFSLSADAVFTAAVTSPLETPAGFDAVLTLFEFAVAGSFLGTYEFLTEGGFGFIDPITLTAGNYVLALTQYSNLYNFAGGFEYDAAPDGMFTYDLFGDQDFDGVPDVSCTSFVSIDGGCRSGNYVGSLTLESEDVPQPVPEPGSLTLLALGSAALLARRGRRSRPGTRAALKK